VYNKYATNRKQIRSTPQLPCYRTDLFKYYLLVLYDTCTSGMFPPLVALGRALNDVCNLTLSKKNISFHLKLINFMSKPHTNTHFLFFYCPHAYIHKVRIYLSNEPYYSPTVCISVNSSRGRIFSSVFLRNFCVYLWM